MELEGSFLLWAPFREPNYSFKQVLLPVRPVQSSNQQKACKIWNSVIFHHDNPRLHMTRQKLVKLGLNIFTHLSHSPDITFTFLVFSGFSSWTKKKFNSFEDCKSTYRSFFVFFLLRKIKILEWMELGCCLKIAEDSVIKLMSTNFLKIIFYLFNNLNKHFVCPKTQDFHKVLVTW